jgi:RsiW-degrading membrane proteinase PrsW (M82 family)
MRATVVAGADAGRVLTLPAQGRLRLGRSGACDVRLHDPKVSGKHAMLDARGGRVTVIDLRSKYGTWVNGKRIAAPVVLRGGDRLWLGDTVVDIADRDSGPRDDEAAAGPTSTVGRLSAAAADVALLRPLRGPADPPRLAAVQRAISTSFAAGAITLCVLVVAVTLLGIGVTAGPVVFLAALLMAVLPVPVYVALALMVDRNEREPREMLVLVFLWGAFVATGIALVLNSIGASAVQSGLGERAGEIYFSSISAPVVEEVAKAAVLLIIYRRFRDEFDGVVDGIVYAVIVGLGFAATENILYYTQGAVEQGVPGALGTFVVRGLFSPFSHPLFTAMTGVGLGLAIRSSRRSIQIAAPVFGLASAVCLHSLWNTSVDLEIPVPVYAGVMVPLFLGMLFLIHTEQRRECRLVGHYLQRDVRSGALARGELAVLADPGLRRLALKRANARGGKAGRRKRQTYHQAATELAFLRDRVARGQQPWQKRTAEQHARYEAALKDARERLGPLLHVTD